MSTCEDLQKEGEQKKIEQKKIEQKKSEQKKSEPGTITTGFQAEESELHLLVSIPRADSNNHDKLSFRLRVNLDQVLDEVPFDGAFAHLLIADDTGNVVVQKGTVLGGGTDGLRITHFDHLLTAEAKPLEVETLQRSTELLDLPLAEEDYKLLCQPLRLGAVHAGSPASKNGEDQESREATSENVEGQEPREATSENAEDQESREATWVICGLVPSGLASSESSLWSALAVSPTLLLVLVLLLFFGLLAWPFIKLFAMSRRERFRFADACFLLVSTFGILILTTILLVDTDSYFRLQDASFDSLSDLAIQVEQHMMDEFRELYDQLDTYDLELYRRYKDQSLSQCTLRSDSHMLVDKRKKLDLDLDVSLELSLVVDSVVDLVNLVVDWVVDLLAYRVVDLGKPMNLPGDRSPYFGSVFWMGPEDGRQFIKGTIWEKNTPAVELKSRSYFSAAEQWRLWSVGGGGWCRENREGMCGAKGGSQSQAAKRCFFVQSFRSITTGEHSAALSKWSCLSGTLRERHKPGDSDKDCKDKNGTVVAAISGRLVSVTNPVLAPGYGFAVIEPNGRILFHSDNRRILEENLFQEVRDSSRLRSAVISRTERMMTSSYLSRPHQLYVKPFRDLPWSIVTFADKELLNTARLECLAHAVILSICYLLCYFLFSLIYLLATGKQTNWLWPDPNKEPLYRHLTVLFGVLLVLFALSLHFLPASCYLVLCFTFPAVSVALASLRLRRRRPSEGSTSTPAVRGRLLRLWGSALGRMSGMVRWIPFPRRWKDDSFLVWHYAAVVLLWFLIAILPAYGFYKLAFKEQQRLLVKVENLYVADRLEQRACAIADYYEPIASGPEPAVPWDFLRKRWNLRRRDVYLSTLFAPSGYPLREGSAGRAEVSARVEKRRDRVKILTIKAQGNDFDSLTPWRWLARYKPLYNDTATQMRYLQPSAADDDAWTWREDGDIVFSRRASECGEPVHLLSALPVPSPILGISTWIGGLVMTLLLLAWVRYSARFLYFARIEGQLKLFKAETLVRGKLETNMIALIVAPRDRKAILQSPHYERVSLDVGEPAGEPGGEIASGRKEPPIVCEHFEYGLGDPTSRALKLRLLEKLVFELGRRVLILSSIDPFEKLCQVEVSAGEAEAAEESSDSRSIRLEEEEARRWVHLLSKFVLMPVALAGEAAAEQVPSPAPGAAATASEIDTAFINREIDTSLPFQRLVRDHLDTPGIGRKEALERILETAGGYYRWLWTACSDGEKLVLVQLAEEGFVNPKQHRTVRRLLQRGLVVRDPVLRLMSPGFALFVDRIHAPEDVARWEELTRGLGWANLRWAFLALLAVIVVFLSATQKQLLETTLGFASALAVAVPGILRLLGVLNRGGYGGPDQGE
ncbi:MAG: hypothetical protein GY856_33680 [bacterium]|nr:hypothetical protein [bacterium]